MCTRLIVICIRNINKIEKTSPVKQKQDAPLYLLTSSSSSTLTVETTNTISDTSYRINLSSYKTSGSCVVA